MGVAPEDYPLFAHLPFVMGQDNAKLSKRNGEIVPSPGIATLVIYQKRSVIAGPAGWSPGEDREDVTMKELVELFTVRTCPFQPSAL
jgi:glutamyl-tRNA synthetase